MPLSRLELFTMEWGRPLPSALTLQAQERNRCPSLPFSFDTKTSSSKRKLWPGWAVWLHTNINAEVNSSSCGLSTPEALSPIFCPPPGFHVSVNRLHSWVPNLSPCMETQTDCCHLPTALQAAKNADSCSPFKLLFCFVFN